jgi:hypothetical protein
MMMRSDLKGPGGETGARTEIAKAAKRNADQAVENKGLREMAESAASMKSTPYGTLRETFRFARRNLFFSLYDGGRTG